MVTRWGAEYLVLAYGPCDTKCIDGDNLGYYANLGNTRGLNRYKMVHPAQYMQGSACMVYLLRPKLYELMHIPCEAGLVVSADAQAPQAGRTLAFHLA